MTTVEYNEWGNPNEPEFYDYIKSYSPYDNTVATAYPHLLITGGLNDPRVTYWEPAKWVARLRELKTDDNELILKTNMGAGHGGNFDGDTRHSAAVLPLDPAVAFNLAIALFFALTTLWALLILKALYG